MKQKWTAIFEKKGPGKCKVKTTKKAVRANPKATPRLCEILLVAESPNSDESRIMPKIWNCGLCKLQVLDQNFPLFFPDLFTVQSFTSMMADLFQVINKKYSIFRHTFLGNGIWRALFPGSVLDNAPNTTIIGNCK